MLDLRKHFNARIGRFLFKERNLAGVSLNDVEKRLNIAPMDLKRWEWGYASPTGMDFIKLVRMYGRGAYRRAEWLWVEIQNERAWIKTTKAADINIAPDILVLENESLSNTSIKIRQSNLNDAL